MKPPPVDTRMEQAERAADYMERHPDGSTIPEIAAAADLGSGTKVLSDMRRTLGYGVVRGPDRWVSCAFGGRRRHLRTYVLTHRPAPESQLDLFPE